MMDSTRKSQRLVSRMGEHRRGGGPFGGCPSLVGGSAPPPSSSSDVHRPRLSRTAGVRRTRNESAKVPESSLSPLGTSQMASSSSGGHSSHTLRPRKPRDATQVEAEPKDPSLRAVRIVSEQCNRKPQDRSGPRGKTVRINKVRKKVRFATPIQSHLEPTNNGKTVDRTENTNRARSTGLRVLQLNMRRSAAVSGEVRQLALEKRLDVLLLQEPYVRKQKSSHIFYGLGTGMRVAAVRSQRPWAAVAVCNPRLEMLFVSQLSTTHCVCVEVQAPELSFYVVSCYFQHSDEIEEHLRHLETVCRSLRGKRLLIAADANARSSLWGPQDTDERGAKFEDLIRAFGFQVLNDAAQPPTFWTARGSSFIDVTLASPNMSQFIDEWRVREDWTSSDHNSVDMRVGVPKGSGSGRSGTGRFDTRRADWDRFSDCLRDLSGSRLEVLQLQSAEEVESMAKELTAVLQEACKGSMPVKRNFRRSNPWWTKELTIIKKSVYRLRRAVCKGRSEPNYLAMRQEYRASLRQYSKEIKRAKVASWQKFVTSHGNSEAWGYVYKQQAEKLRVRGVLNTLRRGECSTSTIEETASYLLDVHVPDDRENEDNREQKLVRDVARVAPNTDDAPFFTELEVVQLAKTLKSNKAPGPDLIEVSVLKAATKVIPDHLVRLFNGCLRWGVFPSVWKVGSLRALLKGGDKDATDPKSYRPICLLSVIGKLLEKLIKLRLQDTSLAPGNVSARQFGFMPGKSTEDAVVELRRMVEASEKRYAVALLFDISGAFDNVWWPLVLNSLKDRNCPRNVFEVLRSYFSDRRVQIELGQEIIAKRATRGCPQGSVLGPACWTVMFDGLLRLLERSTGSSFVAYADDLLVLVEGDSRREIELAGQRNVDTIINWCAGAKLQISEQKTEAILLRSSEIHRAPIGRRGGDRPDRKRKTNKRKVDFESRPPVIKIGTTSIKFKNSVRYLGVHFDKNMGVSAHCQYLGNKVGSLFDKLGKLARANWGLRSRTLSIIYRGVFIPMVAYASAGWSDLCTESDLKVLRSMQRRVLIAVAKAYRTASFEGLCVATGKLPVDILLEKRRAEYYVRKGKDAKIGQVEISATSADAKGKIKMEAISKWQARWQLSQKGRTTFAFFNNVQGRLDLKDIFLTHWTTQVLTGHGNFGARLASLGLTDGETCQCGERDTAQHFLLDCPSFEPQREALRDQVPDGSWVWPEAAHHLVSNPTAYSVFADFCRECLWLKSQEDE